MATAVSPRQGIDTGKVAGRRQVHYESLDDVLADAERLAGVPHRTLGNWSLGMISKHIATALDMGIDGNVPGIPGPLRPIVRMLLLNKMLASGMPAGRKLPQKPARVLMPSDTSDQEGIDLLRKSIARWHSNSTRKPHPFFGQLTPEQWDRLELRHAELHMSFVVPQ